MAESKETENIFTPPNKIEEIYSATNGNAFSAINAPTAGARYEQELPRGTAKFQLYSLATPNGQKVSILLEELGIDYDAHKVNIGKGEQFSSGFVSVNPNSKIPSAVDLSDEENPIKLFESASIVLHLAEKHNAFLPKSASLRAEVMNWVFWQMGGQGPMTGNFGHFFVYAPEDKIAAREYGISRFGMEVQRLCDVLEKHLSSRTYMVGEEYTIADIMIFPWFQALRTGYKHKSGITANDFLSVPQNYPHVVAWADRILSRPAVQRGMTVCSWAHDAPKPWLISSSEQNEAK